MSQYEPLVIIAYTLMLLLVLREWRGERDGHS